MHTIGYYLGVSKQSEVLFLVLVGICCTIFDASLFNLQTNLYKVWKAPMDPSKFTDTAQLYVKYILSSIVLVRTFTVHIYLAFYIVMLWPAIFEEKPGLLIPWLIVGAVKCLAMGAMSLSTGMYICLTYRFSKAACWDFLIAQIIDQGPSIYMWFCILSYYYELKKKVPEPVYRPIRQTPSTVFSLVERRRRVRSLLADKKLQNTFDDDRQLISVSTIDNIINQLNISLNRHTSRSLDSLLATMAAEAEKEEILNTKDEIVEDDNGLSIADKTLKALNLSPSYVKSAKSRKFFSDATTSKDKTLKVHSSPILVVKKSLPDIRRKVKILPKVTTEKSDQLSLILSEAELNTVGFSDLRLAAKNSGKQLKEVHRHLNFLNADSNSEIDSLYQKEIPLTVVADIDQKEGIIPNEDLTDIHIGEDSYLLSNSEIENIEEFKKENIGSGANTLQILSPTKEISKEQNLPEPTVNQANLNEIKLSRTSSSPKDISKEQNLSELERSGTNEVKAPIAKAPNVKPVAKSKIPTKTSKINADDTNKVSTIKKLEHQVPPKLEQKAMSTSKAVYPTPPKTAPVKTLKSKSQGTNDYIVPLPSSFKHDGYTLAYIENKKRKAAEDIIKNTRRPSSSGV